MIMIKITNIIAQEFLPTLCALMANSGLYMLAISLSETKCLQGILIIMIRIIKITMSLCREVDWFKNGRCSTAENLVIFIWNQIHPLIPHPAVLDQVLSSLIQPFQTMYSHPSSSSSRLGTLISLIQPFQTGTLIPHPSVLDQVLSSLIQQFQTRYSHPSSRSSRPGTLIPHPVVRDQVLSSLIHQFQTSLSLIQQFQIRFFHPSSSTSN